jgi:ankyrin repeat protein
MNEEAKASSSTNLKLVKSLIPYPETNDKKILKEDHLNELCQSSINGKPEIRFNELKDLLYENSLLSLEKVVVGHIDDTDNVSFVDYQDDGGQTLLHLACFWGKPDAVDLLISLGANIDLKNIEDRTPLDIAIDWNHDECAELIRNAGGRSSLEDALDIIKSKNFILLKTLDNEKRKCIQLKHELETSQIECALIRQERDASKYQSSLYLNRAEAAEKSTAGIMKELHKMTKEKVYWENKSLKQDADIQTLRASIIKLAKKLKTVIIEKHTLLVEKMKFEKKYNKICNKLEIITNKYNMIDVKYEASKLKLILLSKELRKRDIEVVRLSKIEKKALDMQRALLNYKSQTLMEALHRLVPVEILSGAFRTLQSLARAGEKVHPYYGGKNVKKPGGNTSRGRSRSRSRRKKVLRPSTASSTLRGNNKSFMVANDGIRSIDTPADSDGTPTAAATPFDFEKWKTKVDQIVSEKSSPEDIPEIELEWQGREEASKTCRLLGCVKLPFPLLAVTPGGVRCIVVTNAIYDAENGQETLSIVDGVSAEDINVDRELAPPPSMKELEKINWLDGNGRWSCLANKNINKYKKNRRKRKEEKEKKSYLAQEMKLEATVKELNDLKSFKKEKGELDEMIGNIRAEEVEAAANKKNRIGCFLPDVH